MFIRLPPKRIREKFNLLYELEGAKKASNYLTNFYEVRKMKIRLNGWKVGNGYEAVYYDRQAFFTKRGLKKRNVLHELCHHLVCEMGFELSEKAEEREANSYAKCFLRN